MIKGAGIIIVDFFGQEPKVLCLLNDYKKWDFPKGHCEVDESLIETALRETREECGLTGDDFQVSSVSVSTDPYKVPEGFKVVTYYFAERTSEKVPFLPVNPYIGKPEHIAWKWMPVGSLYDRMSRRMHPVIETLENWVNDTLQN